MDVTFYHVPPDEELYFSELPKHPREIPFTKYRSVLKHINDDEICTKVPEDTTLMTAPDSLYGVSMFIKRPSLWRYEYEQIAFLRNF